MADGNTGEPVPAMMGRECERCGGPIPDHKRIDAMYCSQVCCKADYGELLRAGLLADKANRPPCEGCGAPIDPARFVTTRFCCSECHRRWIYRQTIEARPVQTCEGCGAEFRPTRHDAVQRYCSRKCSNTIGRLEPARPCDQCGTVMDTPRLGQKFCNKLCQGRFHKAKKRKG